MRTSTTQLALRGATALLVAFGAYVHFRLWSSFDYDKTPVAELFVANVVASFVAVLLLGVFRWWSPTLAVAVAGGSLVAFALSRTTGLPTLINGTFDESGLQPEAFQILGVSATLLMLVAEAGAVLTGLLAMAQARRVATD